MTKLYHVTYHVYSTVGGHTKSEFSTLDAAMDHAKNNSVMMEKTFRVVARYKHKTDPTLNTDIVIATFEGENMALAGDGSKLIW